MSVSFIKDIVKIVEQVPNELTDRYIQMLNQLILNFVSLTQQNLVRNRSGYQVGGLSVTGTKRRNPRVPFEVGRDDKLSEHDPDQDNSQNKMRFS